MHEFSVFVGEKKMATVFTNCTLEAIAEFIAKHGAGHKRVWAMRVGHVQEEAK